MFTLTDFVTESNRIEGLPAATPEELAAYEVFLAERVITIPALERFVKTIAHAGIRERFGMNVRVGAYHPPHGGPKVVSDLFDLLRAVANQSLTPWQTHHQYESLHPFMDGNGRSGRALWLWQMGGIDRVPLGFLHTWYYESLQNWHTWYYDLQKTKAVR